MINYTRCLILAEKYGVDPAVIENDYLVEMILAAIAHDDVLKEIFIFRGGTCLHKVYFENYRFSEDIDFTFGSSTGVDNAGKEMLRVLEKLKSKNPEILGWTTKREPERMQFFVQYAIVREIGNPKKELKLDICEAPETPANTNRTLRFLHDEFKNEKLTINTNDIEAIAADKISRTISANKEARDIYDLKYLLSEDIETGKMNVEFRKVHSHDIDPVDLIHKINDINLKKTWETRLSHQIKDLPEYDSFIRQLARLIKEKYKDSFQE